MIKVIIDDVEFALDNQKPMSIHTMKIEKIGAKVIIDGVEYVPKEAEAKEWPQQDAPYWYLDEYNRKEGGYFGKDGGDTYDTLLIQNKNLFLSEQKAEYERLRRECMATRWVPEEGEKWHAAGPEGPSVVGLTYSSDSLAVTESILLGLAAPTKEEAQDRWDKYGEAWLDALKPN